VLGSPGNRYRIVSRWDWWFGRTYLAEALQRFSDRCVFSLKDLPSSSGASELQKPGII
jgi:hypothetical protein